MIVDSPITSRIALGSGRILPQDGDAQLVVPPVLLPTINVLLPHAVPASLVDPQKESFIVESIFSRNNQAATTQTIATLEKGYWDLNFSWSIAWNPAFALGDTNNFIRIDTGGFSIRLMVALPLVGPWFLQFLRHFEILLPNNAVLTHGVGATTPAQSIDSVVSVVGGRRL